MSDKKTSILLVIPRTSQKRSSAITQAGAEHLGIGYLASYIRKFGYHVSIINMEIVDNLNIWQVNKSADNVSYGYVLEKIEKEKIDLVGITVTLLTIHESLELSNQIKERFSGVQICFGGPHVSVCPEQVLENEKSVDFVIVGDGEEPLLSLVDAIENNAYYSQIPGLVYRQSNKVKVNKFKSSVNEKIDSLPFPARDDLLFAKKFGNIYEARLSTSRGCKENCTFCCDPVIYPDRKWVGRSATLVVDEIEYLHKEFGITHFWINDDNFIPPTEEGRRRAEEIARQILSRDLNITYRALFRANTFYRNDELLPLLSRSGLRIAYVGFESGSQIKLKRYNKQTTVEQYYIIVNELKKNNIGLQIGFIMFDPFTTFEELRQDSKFLRDIGEMYLFSNFLQILDVFPKTSISKMMIKQGLLPEEVGYKSNYCNYKFYDRRVEAMARDLNSCYWGDLVDVDKLLQRMHLIDIPALYSGLDNNLAHKFKEEMDEYFENINRRNFSFFCSLASWAENNQWDSQHFYNSLQEVLSYSKEQLKHIHKHYVTSGGEFTYECI